VAWRFDFTGGSGSSPLVIGSRVFFDGGVGTGGGSFMAVDDTGMRPVLVWRREFPAHFFFSTVEDPRGGLWVATVRGSTLMRLN
jgi:hypothetical protein